MARNYKRLGGIINASAGSAKARAVFAESFGILREKVVNLRENPVSSPDSVSVCLPVTRIYRDCQAGFKFIHWQPQLEQSRWRCRLDSLHPRRWPRLPVSRGCRGGRPRAVTVTVAVTVRVAGTGTPAPGPGPGDTVTGDSGPAEHSD